MEITLLLIAIVIGLLFLKRTRDRSDAGLKKFPPGPICLPLIGSAYALGTSSNFYIHVVFHKLAVKYGPIYRLKVGPTDVVVLTDPDTIKESFSSISSPCLLRFTSGTTKLMDKEISLMLTTSRAQWAMMRRIFQPMVRSPGIPQVIRSEYEKLQVIIDKHINKEVYLNPLFTFFTRNVFLKLTLSKSWSFDTQDEEEKSFNRALLDVMENMTHPLDYIPSLNFLLKKRQKIAESNCRFIEDLAKREIPKRYPLSENPRDFLDLLLKEMQDFPECSEEAMLISYRNVLFAASMTVADTLDWMLLYLCTHPDLQDKCHKEISDKLCSRIPTLDDQADLVYLDAVIKETLRIRPAAPLSLPHYADQDCTIGGYHVAKGSVVLQNLYGIGNSERYFKNASQFDPDRWLRDPNLASNLPFGFGPTSCLGMGIAKQECFLAAASMLQKYKFRIAPSNPHPDFTGEFKITFNPKPWNTLVTLR